MGIRDLGIWNFGFAVEEKQRERERREEMKVENVATSSSMKMKMQSSEGGNPSGGKGRYKFWALAALLLLAFWSMFSGSVTLKWSASNLSRYSDDIDSHIHDDLDILVSLFFFFFLFLSAFNLIYDRHLAGIGGERETG